MKEEHKTALNELVSWCKKYKVQITSIECRVNFAFNEEKGREYYYVHGFDRYTRSVNKWDTIQISEADENA